ncbi:PrsW family intramembrane metalloprotease [Corynebacterium ulceribovis]|uniref:PrsW family intramembrane metalloprotease n=1 Tax=Corynebacterium ulceribovis TaxID=487732 RepID=UPI00037E2DCC|nr:PrsW family intramembrane metalloprotease [Corynebacterium ulceribovis]
MQTEVVQAELVQERQPNKLFLLLFWLMTVIGTVVALVLIGMEVPTILPVVAMGVALAALICGVVLWLMARTRLWPDKKAKAVWLALAGMAWGSGGTMVILLPSATAWQAIMEWADITPLVYSFAGAWPEETAKALGVIVIMLAFPQIWNRPWHGLLLGTSIGLGFEMLENILYGGMGGYTHATSDIYGGAQMWGLRMLLGPGMHAMWTGIVGALFGYALLASTNRGQMFGRIALGWLIGFGLHFAWNIQWPVEPDSYVHIAWPLTVYVPTLALYVLAWRRALRDARAMDTAAEDNVIAEADHAEFVGAPGWGQQPNQ